MSTGKGHLRSYEVINSFFANISRDGGKYLKMVQNYLPGQDASIDM